MTEAGDLLKKADALLDRYRFSHPEQDFPVLTEVVKTESEAADPVLTDVVDRIEPEWPSPQAANDLAVPADMEQPTAASSQDTEQAMREVITRQFCESLSLYLPDRLASDLQERLHARLGEAVNELSTRMHKELDSMVRSCVEHAILQALESLEKSTPPD